MTGTYHHFGVISMRVSFRDGSTPLHRLNPVAKLIVLLAFCILAVFSRHILVQAAGLGTALSLLLASGPRQAAYAVHASTSRCLCTFAASSR